MSKVQAFEADYLRKKIPEFKPGDTVRVHLRVVEGDRERIQVFQGIVIKRHGKGLREMFTVRKISFGVGTERMFPVHSPMIAKIEIKSRGTVHRAKLYYLRDRVGKKARVKEMFMEGGLPVSTDIEHSDEERKRLGIDEKEEEPAEVTDAVEAEKAPVAGEAPAEVAEEAPVEAVEEAPAETIEVKEAGVDEGKPAETKEEPASAEMTSIDETSDDLVEAAEPEKALDASTDESAK